MSPTKITVYGGRYLVCGSALTAKEGTWSPKRSVVLEVPWSAQLKA
jgi:uncharacterized protein (DUF1330 family)